MTSAGIDMISVRVVKSDFIRKMEIDAEAVYWKKN